MREEALLGRRMLRFAAKVCEERSGGRQDGSTAYQTAVGTIRAPAMQASDTAYEALLSRG
jgi:hypothetical protein